MLFQIVPYLLPVWSHAAFLCPVFLCLSSHYFAIMSHATSYHRPDCVVLPCTTGSTATAATNREALSITTVTRTLDETSQTTVPATQNHKRSTRPLCAGLQFSQAKVCQGNYFIYSIWLLPESRNFQLGGLPNCKGCHLPLLSNSCIFSCLFLLVIDPEGVLRQLKFLEQLWQMPHNATVMRLRWRRNYLSG